MELGTVQYVLGKPIRRAVLTQVVAKAPRHEVLIQALQEVAG